MQFGAFRRHIFTADLSVLSDHSCSCSFIFGSSTTPFLIAEGAVNIELLSHSDQLIIPLEGEDPDPAQDPVLDLLAAAAGGPDHAASHVITNAGPGLAPDLGMVPPGPPSTPGMLEHVLPRPVG